MRPCPVCASSDVEFFCAAVDRVAERGGKQWEIRRCRNCRCGWTWPPLPEEEIAAHYPAAYLGDTQRTLEDFLSGRLTGTRSWRREMEKVRVVERFVSGGSILDVGTADAKFLLALNASKWERTGVEFNSEVVGLVRSRIPDLQLLAGDICSKDLSPGSFDVITFWHVFEHLPDPRRVLRRVCELLRPGGWLFVSLPNFDSWQAGLFRRHWYAFDDVPRHLYHYSPRALELLLHQTGLQPHRRVFFSRMVNIHCLKYSLIHWSEEHFGGRAPYYALKPLLFVFQWLEGFSGRYGMLTMVARKEPE